MYSGSSMLTTLSPLHDKQGVLIYAAHLLIQRGLYLYFWQNRLNIHVHVPSPSKKTIPCHPSCIYSTYMNSIYIRIYTYTCV